MVTPWAVEDMTSRWCCPHKDNVLSLSFVLSQGYVISTRGRASCTPSRCPRPNDPRERQDLNVDESNSLETNEFIAMIFKLVRPPKTLDVRIIQRKIDRILHLHNMDAQANAMRDLEEQVNEVVATERAWGAGGRDCRGVVTITIKEKKR